MNWLIYFLFFLLLFYLSLIYRALKKQQRDFNPFKDVQMNVILKCKKCSWSIIAPFKKGDYLFKVVVDERTKHDCDGEVEIIGCFVERKKNPEELKWEEYIRKFK